LSVYSGSGSLEHEATARATAINTTQWRRVELWFIGGLRLPCSTRLRADGSRGSNSLTLGRHTARLSSTAAGSEASEAEAVSASNLITVGRPGRGPKANRSHPAPAARRLMSAPVSAPKPVRERSPPTWRTIGRRVPWQHHERSRRTRPPLGSQPQPSGPL